MRAIMADVEVEVVVAQREAFDGVFGAAATAGQKAQRWCAAWHGEEGWHSSESMARVSACRTLGSSGRLPGDRPAVRPWAGTRGRRRGTGLVISAGPLSRRWSIEDGSMPAKPC